jgi:hypothetical protein
MMGGIIQGSVEEVKHGEAIPCGFLVGRADTFFVRTDEKYAEAGGDNAVNHP